MRDRVVLLSLTLVTVATLASGQAGQSAAPALQLVTRAADALGGRDRLLAVKTLQIFGYGELAYFNGGGNITGDPAAPQKWQKVLDYTRTIDLEHSRTRVQQRLKMDFEFASTVGQLGLNRTNESLDGDIAYNVGGWQATFTLDRRYGSSARRSISSALASSSAAKRASFAFSTSLI